MTALADRISAPASMPPGSDLRAMSVAVLIALAVHALLLFGVGFELPAQRAADSRVIDVLLIRQGASDLPPSETALVGAQASRDGETTLSTPELPPAGMLDGPADGAVDGSDGAALSAEQPASLLAVPLPLELPSEAEPLQEPLPAPEQETEPEPLPEPKPEPTAVSEPQPQPEAEPEPEPTPQPRPDPEPVVTADVSALAPALPPRISAADILASRHAEIERLTARIDAQGSAAASRARRKAISTSTREYRYSSYMEAWRRKVERIGNLNYPEEAARQGLFGALILHVAVRADGSLEGVRVVRSSGHAVLDQAAIRIVQLAAPYAPFPDDIAAETDVLDITRTWQFQRNNRLGWDN